MSLATHLFFFPLRQRHLRIKPKTKNSAPWHCVTIETSVLSDWFSLSCRNQTQNTDTCISSAIASVWGFAA